MVRPRRPGRTSSLRTCIAQCGCWTRRSDHLAWLRELEGQVRGVSRVVADPYGIDMLAALRRDYDRDPTNRRGPGCGSQANVRRQASVSPQPRTEHQDVRACVVRSTPRDRVVALWAGVDRGAVA